MVEVPAGGGVQTTLGSGLISPESVALDAAGDVFIADYGNNRVVEVPTGGGALTTVGSGLIRPVATAVDGAGDVFIAEYGNNQVLEVQRSQPPTLSFAATAVFNTSTDSPQSVTVQNIGNQSLTAVSPGLAIGSNSFEQVAGSGTPADCTSSFSLAPGASCNLSLSFIPQKTGSIVSAATFTDNALNTTPSASQSITLNGTGLPGTYTIGGTVSGLSGTGLVLQDNGGNNLTVSAGATSFTFTTAIASGSAYSVTVLTQPSSPAQTCVVTNGSGTASANVTSVLVACTTVTYTIGGTVSGLSGTGLVLQDNGGNNLSVGAGATTFTFTTALASGGAYSVTVLTQPSSPAQTCVVTGGSGTASANVTSIRVACTTTPVTLSASSLNLGSVAVGDTSAAKTVKLTNHGNVALDFSSILPTTNFGVSSNTCGASIAAGAACTVGVTFSPTAAGAVTGTLTFTDSAENSPQVVSLTGTGTTPVTLSPSTLTFAAVAVGDTSAAKTVKLTNHGNVALDFSSILPTTNFGVSSNTCGASIAAGAACTVGVTFSPTAAGAVTGTLTFTDSAENSPQVVSLTGTGTTPVTLSPSTLTFAAVAVGGTSAAKTVKLTNHGNVALDFSSILPTTNFGVSSNTCGASIAAGAACTVGVTFSPTAAGAVTGTLTFTDSAENSPQVVNLTGTGK